MSDALNIYRSLSMYTLNIKKLHPDAKLPTNATELAAGNDLYSIERTTISPNSIARIRTGIALEMPKYHYGRLADRSSMAIRGLQIVGGVIDCDYRGEIVVLMRNNTNRKVSFGKGNKIAQFILTKISYCSFREVDFFSSNTERGRRGFGSSGQTEVVDIL